MQKKTAPPLFTLTCEEQRNQRTPTSECYNYLNNFRNESPAREKFFDNLTNHGVYVSFTENNPGFVMTGRFFYPGILKTIGKDKFVVGFGASDKLCSPERYDEFAIKPDKTYFISDYTVKLNTQLDAKAALEQIEIPVDKLHKPADRISPDILAERNNEYRRFFFENIADVVFGSGFMQSNSLEDLQRQPDLDGVTAVGYCIFIGYDKSLNIEKNRLLFIAVNSEGKLILDDNAITLERSWPPK
jgi:hypothetical protein